MSSDNTRAALEDRLGLRVESEERQAASSDNHYLSALAAKCLPHKITNRPEGSYEEFLASIFGRPTSEVLTCMYLQEEMSVADIRTWLIENIGWCVCERQVNVILRRAGVALRGYAERKRLAWKQGKLDEALAKTRQACKQAYFIGSSVERMVRYLLQVSLSALNLPWHVIIGDNLQLILSRYEVDIPVVVVNPATGLSCRFAIEVDATFVHGNDKTQLTDRTKDIALQATGWNVYRMNGDSVQPTHIVPQVVDIAVDIKRVCREVLSAEDSNGRTSAIHQSCHRRC